MLTSARRSRHCKRPVESPEAPLRVAFVSTQYPPAVGGGIGRFTADLARTFAGAGHEVHVFSAQGPTSTVSFEDGVWVHRFPEVPFVPETLAGEAALLDVSRIGSVYRELVHAHLHRPFDVVSSPIWLAEGLLVAMDPRFVTILSLHTTTKTLAGLERYWRSTPRSLPLTVLERLAVAAHQATHANSRASLAKVGEEYGAPRHPFVIPHGVADHSSRFVRRRGANGSVRILLAGRLDSRKGGDIALDVMAKVLRRFPTAEFVLVGEPIALDELDGRSLPEAVSYRHAAEPELLRRIRFTGVVPDDELYQHYADGDMFLAPSRYESFGLPVVEAMSFGLPIVASAAGAMPEIVVHGENGLLVDLADGAAAVDALGTLIDDPDRRRRLGATSRRRYLAAFSLAVSGPRTMAAYRSIAAERRVEARRAAFGAPAGLATRFAQVIETVTVCRGAAALAVAHQLVGDTNAHERPAGVLRRVRLRGRRLVARLRALVPGTGRRDAPARSPAATAPSSAARRRGRTAIVWLTHFVDPEGIASVRRLASQAGSFGTVVCAHHAAGEAGDGNPGIRTLRLDDADLQAALPQRFAEIAERGAALNDAVDLVHFASMHRLPDFDHWWFVEYDTDFSGDWRVFFSRFEDCQADLLGTTIYPRTLDPRWFFWPDLATPPGVSPAAHVRGFFPVVRFSRRFAETYRAQVDNGWRGHFEALYPTIALFRGLRVEDIGGAGPFVPECRRGLWYRNTYDDVGLSPGTFRFAPVVSTHYFSPRNDDLSEPDRLWHPIKTRGYREHARTAGNGRRRRWPHRQPF
jgi:glycosyltransferase involved in cell wall biosynthesis